MVILTLSVNAKLKKRIELLSACRLITEKTRKEKGCIACLLSQDIDNENLIQIEEKWEHRSDLNKHVSSDTFSALLGALKLLGETHEIRINEGSKVLDMNDIEAVRLKKP